MNPCHTKPQRNQIDRRKRSHFPENTHLMLGAESHILMEEETDNRPRGVADGLGKSRPERRKEVE